MLLLSEVELAELLRYCGFESAKVFDGIPEDLKRRLIREMNQWRWDRKRLEFDRMYLKMKEERRKSETRHKS